MRRLTYTRVTRVKRLPVTIDARPVNPPRRRGPNPAMHDFYGRLIGACVALLIVVPLWYVVAKDWDWENVAHLLPGF